MLKAILARIVALAAFVAPVIVGATLFVAPAQAQEAGNCLVASDTGADNTCAYDVHVRYEDGDGAQLTISAGTSVVVATPRPDGLAACQAPSYPENVMYTAGAAPAWNCAGIPAGSGGGDSGVDANKTSSTEHFALGAGIIILAGAAFGAWQNGDASAFSMTPTSEHSYADGSWRTRHGTRLNYHGDEWSLWWSAETENVFGESSGEWSGSRFGWGGAWRGDGVYVDAAALISPDGTDFRAGAGADWDVRGWALRPSWEVRAAALDSGGWDSRLDAGLAAEWARLGWKVRPSLGATGSLRDAADSAAFMRLRVERTLGR